MTKIEKEKHDMLLLWFQEAKNNNGRVTMEEFDKRFQWLFRKRALFYSWGMFYRDHGFVGLRSRSI